MSLCVAAVDGVKSVDVVGSTDDDDGTSASKCKWGMLDDA